MGSLVLGEGDISPILFVSTRSATTEAPIKETNLTR